MARTPNTTNTTPAVSELDEGRLQEAESAAQQLGDLQANYAEGRDLVNQMLGQIQVSRAISKFTDVMSLQRLQQIKENKLYRALEGQKALDLHGQEILTVGTWEGFCRALGVSVAKIDEDLANLNTFGEESLTQLNSMGIGYRDLRKFRKLGDDEKTLLIDAAKSGDKDSFLEYAESLISKHTAEKTDLEKSLSSTKANLVAAEKVSKGHVEKINELTRQVVKFDVDIDLPAAFLDARQKATDAVNTILTELNRLEEIRDQAWDKLLPADDHGKGVHAGELSNLGLVMRGGFIAVNEKLEATLQAFNDTIDRVLAD